ncbi:LPXTG cell wall anchor domain-containing protein [Streptomyces sp. ACA25]|uniref:SCO1860 family LAETG-anchored protein n=1 Tax=Streptomyces sp. ACA25 TaxID=3022596 RepID=UPI0023075B1B|nr:SCO1860 family LAETG-anchored protein [Streptomyces sp. ACA25]MDB1088453.1 LPXTG cell wall anchor domain-containing protein [Streptomyces sp. ACA25]
MHHSASRRSRAHRAAVLLTTATLLGITAPAYASQSDQDHQGSASAAVLRADLNVALLNKATELPLSVALNEVSAPQGEGTAEKTVLTAALDGVDRGRPFEMLRADIASARASSDAGLASAEVQLADVAVHVPGLPLLSVIELEAVQAKASCAAGEAPAAEANALGAVRVLDQEVTLTAGGATEVTVPGVGEVRLELSSRTTTEDTAAAAALELEVSVNPLDLNVAEVDGRIALAEVSCTTPAGLPDESGESGNPGDSGDHEETEQPVDTEGEGPRTRTGAQEEAEETNLAATGGDSTTLYASGAAAALLGAGGLLLFLRRRAAAARSAAGS